MELRIKRVSIIVLVLVFLACVVDMPIAKAAELITLTFSDPSDPSAVVPLYSGNQVTENTSTKTISFEIKISNTSAKSMTIAGITAGTTSGTKVLDFFGTISVGGMLLSSLQIPAGTDKTFSCEFDVDPYKMPGVYFGEVINIEYLCDNRVEKASFKIDVKKDSQIILSPSPVVSPTPAPEPTPPGKAVIVLDSTDGQGYPVAPPSGNNGDKITIILPVRNRGGWISDVEVRPEITTDLNTFPFALEPVNYVRNIGTMVSGSKTILQYDLTLSQYVTKGVKAVKFLVNYSQDGQQYDTYFTVFVNVVKGAPETTPTPTTNVNQSKAKIIVSGFTIEPERVFAGQTFKLNLTLLNTSEKEDVKNIKVSLSNDLGMIFPAASGSNTFFVNKIAKQDSFSHTIELQSSPDAEAKPYAVFVDIEYDGKDGTSITTKETIVVPMNLEMRIKIDDPVVMGETMMDQPAPVMMSIYNLGKTPLYNLMITVVGEGIRVEEDYFGGNVAGGGAVRVDMNIICSVAGQIPANVVITYEDKFGEQTKVEKPLEVFVTDMNEAKPGFNEGEMLPDRQPQKQNKFPILYAVIGGILLILAAVLTVILKKRKAKKSLEDFD